MTAVTVATLSQAAWASCDFNGTSARLINATTAAMTAVGGDVYAWVKVDNTALVKTIFQAYRGATGTDYLALFLSDTEGPLVEHRSSGGADEFASGASAVTPGTWVLVHGQFPSTTSRLAGHTGINGTDNTDSVVFVGAPTVTSVGRRGNTTDLYFDGLIAYVWTTNANLNQTQREEFLTEWPLDASTVANITHLWDFRSACGATVDDEVGSITLTNTDATHNADNPTFAPVWDTGPTFSAISGGIRVTGTSSSAVTAFQCLLPPGASDPTAAACEAGTGAIDFDSDASPASVSIDSLTVYPRAKRCAGLENASGYSALTCSDGNRSAGSGKAIVIADTPSSTSPFIAPTDTAGDTTDTSATIAGMASTTRFDVGSLVTVSAGFPSGALLVVAKDATSITLDSAATSTETNVTVTGLVDRAGAAIFSPAIANSDVFEIDSATSVMSSVITLETDLDVIIEGVGETFASFEFCPEDVSDTTPEFTTPNCWTDDTEGLAYLNNVPPVFSLSPEVGGSPGVLVLEIDEAMTTIDLSGYCTHEHGLTPRVFLRAGYSLPTGLSFNSSTYELSGTPTVLDLDGHPLEWWCEAGKSKLYDLETQTLFLSDSTIDVPVCVGGTVAACLALLEAARPWLASELQLTATFACSEVESGDIISQDPSDTMTAEEAVAVVASTGECGSISVLSCLRRTLAACETLYTTALQGILTVTGVEHCPSAAYNGGLIYAQSPAPGVIVDPMTNVTMTYCVEYEP